MKRTLLLAALAAISTIGAQAHIGWDLATCTQKYGQEAKPLKEANAGEIHYFLAGDMNISVILRNDKVKSILYRKASGEIFSSDEIDILQKKNQAELLGCEGIEWIPNPNAPTGAQIWSLTRQAKPELQTLLIDQGTPQKSAYVLVIRTWDQIAVDQEAAKQDQLDKLKIL